MNKESVSIRKTAIEDFSQAFPLFRQLWLGEELDEIGLRKIFNKVIESDRGGIFCAEVDSKVVGLCSYADIDSFWKADTIAYISVFVVDEKYRRQGIGRKLMESVCDDLKNNGYKAVELDSAFYREWAHEFYQSLGFIKRAYTFTKDMK